MSMRASGTFEVKLTPQNDQLEQETGSQSGSVALARMAIDKQFHGDLEAVSHGQMLSAVTAVQGSAGYVAIERVSGTLNGLSGSFILQHNGIMSRGAPDLTITVVPDSGSDQLSGLSGSMTIRIVEGRHLYDFEYTLDEAN